MRISPDSEGRPLKGAITTTRGVSPECISLGAGSSEIIYRVLPTLYGKGPVVILDPTYSEYPHVIRRGGLQVRRVGLRQDRAFAVELGNLISAGESASLVILVNPNNPTGQALTRREVLDLKASLPPDCALWMDEAYVDYCPPGTSVELDACQIPGLYVLKSLSKAYALSGVRAAYLVCEESRSKEISAGTPPWIIGTSAQSAAAAALQDEDYYVARWRESQKLVQDFAAALRKLGLCVYAGSINAVLVEVPRDRTGTEWADSLATAGIIVRTTAGMGEALGDRFIRIGLVEECLRGEVLDLLKASL